jgi:DNA-binding NarL/FixJ family response regulator
MLFSRFRDTAMLALVLPSDRQAISLAAKTGARGIHDSAIQPDALRAALTRLADGEVVVQPSLVPYLITLRAQPDTTSQSLPRQARSMLTPRELTALQLLARGYTSKQMTSILQSTPKAVDLTIERAMRRLGAVHRAQAVAIALRRGLLS